VKFVPSIMSGAVGSLLMHSVGVYTDCPEESYDFYTRVLGLADQTAHYSSTRPGRWWIGRDTVLIELIAAPDDEMALAYNPISAGVRQLNFVVADVVAVYAHLCLNDVKIRRRPYRPETGDPQQPPVMGAIAPEGTWLQFCEPRVPRPGLEPGTRGLKVRCSAH
jgi:catechol 2,3-dioxygenase-like lactoylglutathione lyase family enzyme